MAFQPTNDSIDARDRLIRVEERLKHMDETQGRVLRELKEAIADLAQGSKLELVETRTRLSELEKRVDKIYWLWSAAIFIGTPIMMAVSKFAFEKLGL